MISGLTLALFVARIGAGHIDATFAADDLAVLADPPDAGSDFHGSFQSIGRKRLSI